MINTSTRLYLFASAILLGVYSNSYAREISYNYVEASYGTGTDSSPGVDVNFSGISLEGSFSVAPNFAVTAGYSSVNFDRTLGIKVDATAYEAGITGHMPIAPNADLLGNISIINAKSTVDNGVTSTSDSDTGNSIAVGIRYMANENIELSGGISREDLFNETTNTFSIAADYFMSDQLSFGIGYATHSDYHAYLLSARYEIK